MAVLKHCAPLPIRAPLTSRLGTRGADGKVTVTFGVVYDDDRCQQIFEALVGTLKAAKKRKIVEYSSPLLLKGTHDKVIITLLDETPIAIEGEASASASAAASKH